MENTAKAVETVTIPKAEYETLRTEYESLKQQVAWLTEQLRLFKRRQFGTSSEKTDAKTTNVQLNYFNEAEATVEPEAEEPVIEEVGAYHRRKPRGAADRFPPDLPVEVVEHKLPDEECVCPECGGALHEMSQQVREEVKLIPASAVIVRHIQSVYACRNCEKHSDHVPIVNAQTPEPVIKGSFASPEAVAHIATQKFVMGVPLYRQEGEWERSGILLSRQTMSNWLGRCARDWLKPIYDRLRRHLCEREVLHADETTLQVLHEPDRAAQDVSYMWLYRTSGDTSRPIVLYDYKPSHAGECPALFLNGFSGYLHTDGYSAYHAKLPESITIAGCWAHARRKFDEALTAIPAKDRHKSEAYRGLELCNRLFALERKYEGLAHDDNFKARLDARMEHTKPLMKQFFDWAQEIEKAAMPKSLLGLALGYVIRQRKRLETVLLDGRLELSNNRAERSIKPFVIGRKNWLFSNTANGAEASAIIYSLVETAKENSIDPFKYLAAVFRDAPNSTDSVESLLPWNICFPV
jgi:transposase